MNRILRGKKTMSENVNEAIINESVIRDIGLAPAGEAKIHWVSQYTHLLNHIQNDFEKNQPFAGRKIAVCLHLEAKTAHFVRILKKGGADVTVVPSNPLSTQDDVVAALVRGGVRAFARYGCDAAEYQECHMRLLNLEPDLIVDDGGDLVTALHARFPHLIPKVAGACEETTTGLVRLRAMEKAKALKIPVIAVNDAQMKYLFDNRYGTGQSVWDSVMHTTNLVVAGKTVVVAGYGWCGKGVAMRAKGLGARVVVTEVDPVKAVEACMDGFEVMPMTHAALLGHFFITVTGNKNVIHEAHIRLMQDGAILANAGHFDVEISKPALEALSRARYEMKPNVEAYEMQDGRKIILLAEGRLVNLASGFGHPAEIMDMSFAIQALSLEYIAAGKAKLSPGVISVPGELDGKVARLRLLTTHKEIDALTQEQIDYMNS
jgi:adenosylhomocysteinase